MGTNYYFKPETGEPIHIGKSSYGWYFALHCYPDEELTSWAMWKHYILTTKGKIIDEYDDLVSYRELNHVVAHRQRDTPPDWSAKRLEENSAEFGNGNLIKAKVDGAYCTGHSSSGTISYFIGDFS